MTAPFCLAGESQLPGKPLTLQTQTPLLQPSHLSRLGLGHDSPRIYGWKGSSSVFQAQAEQAGGSPACCCPLWDSRASQTWHGTALALQKLLFLWHANYPGLRLVRNHLPLQLAAS